MIMEIKCEKQLEDKSRNILYDPENVVFHFSVSLSPRYVIISL